MYVMEDAQYLELVDETDRQRSSTMKPPATWS
jgi:hypothetical protein